jgi:hypothetical protein
MSSTIFDIDCHGLGFWTCFAIRSDCFSQAIKEKSGRFPQKNQKYLAV